MTEPEIIDRVRGEHPYEVPCVLAIPAAAGNPDYLNWVVEQTIELDGDDQA